MNITNFTKLLLELRTDHISLYLSPSSNTMKRSINVYGALKHCQRDIKQEVSVRAQNRFYVGTLSFSGEGKRFAKKFPPPRPFEGSVVNSIYCWLFRILIWKSWQLAYLNNKWFSKSGVTSGLDRSVCLDEDTNKWNAYSKCDLFNPSQWVVSTHTPGAVQGAIRISRNTLAVRLEPATLGLQARLSNH